MAQTKITEKEILSSLLTTAHVLVTQQVTQDDGTKVESLRRVPLTVFLAELYDARNDNPNEDGTENKYAKVGDFLRAMSEKLAKADFDMDFSDLDLKINDEDGYLYIYDTKKGVFIGSGWQPTGGGGSTADSRVKLTCSLASRTFSLPTTAGTCVLPCTWSSLSTEDDTPTGNGTATWYVNNARVAVQKIAQGDFEIDIFKYLVAGQENSVVVKVEDVFGTAKQLPFTISLVSFGLTWKLGEMAVYNDTAVTVRMTPTGSGTKTVKMTLDGAEIYNQEITTSGREISVDVGPLSHGAHTILAWMEMEVEGDTIPSDILRHVGLWTVDGATDKIVGIYTPELTVGQYGTAQAKFMAYDPQSETSTVQLKYNGTQVRVLTDVGRTVQTWAYKASELGDHTMSVVLDDTALGTGNIALKVTSLGYDISPITSGLVFDLDPAGHSNSEAGRENFGYKDANGTNHPLTFSDNFDWVGGGFQQDEDGVTAFVVKRGCYVTADCSWFTDNPKTSGKEIKLIFASKNVRNYDAELLNCMSGKIGLKLQAQTATIGSEAETITVPYCEGKKIEMDVNIESTNENSLAYVCMKAIPSAKPMRYASTDNWTQAAAKLLTIGSEDADVWIYRLKVYGNSLNRYEILDNYIADCADPAEMVARFERNNIFGDDGSLNIGKLTTANPDLRAIHIKAKRMTTSKDDSVVCDVEHIMVSGGEGHHLTAQNAIYKGQGTSSLEYILAALNLDIDFSEATSWVDGNGEDITAYAFTPNSIAVDYFNCKADVASSESANNVVLTDDYNTYNPDPFVGKTGMVRDCIEGHPCAVFFTNTSDAPVSIGARTVAAGETVLYFAGNMNNSKKNFAVFGWDSTKWPEQCCVEILNNIDLQCRFRSDDLSTETWDGAPGTSSFEFAFPKNPTAAMKAKFQELLSWVVSTTRDLATNAALPETVIYNGVPYASDTAAYRAAKFVAEFDNYFRRDQMCFHFLFTERHCMSDNRSKNVFLCYDYYEDIGAYRWSVRRNYDNDTAEGCDNSGGSTFTYGLELNDIVGDSYVYNANDNTIWVNIDALMQEDLLRVKKACKEAWDATRIKKKFNDYQAITPEALRIEDMWNKYFMPLLLAGDDSFLKRCHGPKEYWREQFETFQEVYFDTKYCDTSDRSNCITLRATVSKAEDGKFIITPFSDMYIVVMYGTNGVVKVRAKRNVAYVIDCPTDSLTDTEIYLYGASNYIKLGSLAALKTKFVTLSNAWRLQVLPIGSDETGYQNLNMTELTLGNNTMLEYLDIRGLPKLTGSLDMSNLDSLEEIYASGSGVTNVIFAEGAPVTVAKLPAAGGLTAIGLDELTTFVMDGVNLLNIRVEGSPKIDTLALCKAATGLTRGRLIGVDWTDDNADVLTRLAGLQTNGGISAEGEIINGFVLTGKAHCAVITQPEIDTITAAFPDLELTYGEIVSSVTVTFAYDDGTPRKLKDGTDAVFVTRYGGSVPNPVSAGLMDEPTKESTVENDFVYTGWDTPLTNILSDTVIKAAFVSVTRYYTVAWWYDDGENSRLQLDVVPAHGSSTYNGADLTRADGAAWMGWDKPASDVTSNLDIHAVFVVPTIPDSVATGYDYLYSDDPADNSGYTLAEFYGILINGVGPQYFAVGDKVKIVPVTDVFADKEIICQVYGFNHFKLADGSGKFAGTVFGMLGVMNASRGVHTSNNNAGGWPGCATRTFLNEQVFPALPRQWQTMIRQVEVRSSEGGTSPDIVSSNDYLFLFSHAEVGFDTTAVPYCNEVDPDAEQVAFSLFTSNNSRIKKMYNGTGTAVNWWLRSPDPSNSTYYRYVYNYGGAYSNNASNGNYLSFGFCI